MTNLPRELRERLAERFYIAGAQVARKQVSRIDGTVKYLLRLHDGEHVECVLMEYHHGLSICISTQVGCRMGCTFCATGKSGYSRNLTASEILSEIQTVQKDAGRRISNIVLMGMGEPLDNYDNVLRFLELVSCEEGLNIGMRHISVSYTHLEQRLYSSGSGTQRAEEQLTALFPQARVLRLDADAAMSRFAYEEKLSRFAAGEYDLIVGTQMVAKGLDFENVTLAAVLSADQDVYKRQAQIYQDQTTGSTQYVVALELTEDGAEKFAAATEEYLNKTISIWMDDVMISAPTVESVITEGSASITGVTAEEATKLARQINAGALPFQLCLLYTYRCV